MFVFFVLNAYMKILDGLHVVILALRIMLDNMQLILWNDYCCLILVWIFASHDMLNLFI